MGSGLSSKSDDSAKSQGIDVDPGPKNWFALLLVLSIATMYQVQKYTLAYAYGYQASPTDTVRHLNPTYEITAYYTDLEAAYPFLSGLAVLLP